MSTCAHGARTGCARHWPRVASARPRLRRAHINGEIFMVIKRVGILKLAVFQMVLMAIFGVLIALLFMMFGAMIGSFGGHASAIGGAMGIVALIIFPIMYGVIGFIAGAIGGALYNLVASMIGGIEIEVDQATT